MDNPNTFNKTTNERRRKPYLRPQIEVVSLLPKQTVLGIPCYSSSATGPEETFGCSSGLPKCSE
jgi:hypothetical protein